MAEATSLADYASIAPVRPGDVTGGAMSAVETTAGCGGRRLFGGVGTVGFLRVG